LPLRKNKVEKGLKKKGFQEPNPDKSHIVLVYYTLTGDKSRIATRISRGSDPDIQDCTIARMSKQCQITIPQFRNLVKCPLSQADYEELVARYL